MATTASTRLSLFLLLLRQLTAVIAALVAVGNAYKHQYYLAGIWLVISLTLLLSLVGHRLPPPTRRPVLILLALSWLAALVLLVLYALG